MQELRRVTMRHDLERVENLHSFCSMIVAISKD